MRATDPFFASDLEELHTRLFSQADRVVPMRDIFKGDIGHRVIGLRHDVDDNKGSFETALRMAEWEMEHGYSSTYFLLHDSSYWPDNVHRAGLFEDMGHEVGIHVNAVAEAFRQRRDPVAILADALSELRVFVRVEGCVAHGDELCHKAGFVNDEMFVESARPLYGKPDRLITHKDFAVALEPVPRASFGLLYDAAWLPRGRYISDSGGVWRPGLDGFEAACDRFGDGQLHVLVHPDWWSHAFAGVTV